MIDLITKILKEYNEVSAYKININSEKSCQLFYVHEKLETVRKTDTKNYSVTIYNKHQIDNKNYIGDASFSIYKSDTVDNIKEKINLYLEIAKSINNKNFDINKKIESKDSISSNFVNYDPLELAELISDISFDESNKSESKINALEIFISKYKERIINSNGLDREVIKYGAMVEAIPTYDYNDDSVELYEQYNFNNFDENIFRKEISGKLKEVELRYNAKKFNDNLGLPVLLRPHEIESLFSDYFYDLNYASKYSKSNIFNIGDKIQDSSDCDLINLKAVGQIKGSVNSNIFDKDGTTLVDTILIENGVVKNNFGSHQMASYLNAKETGNLNCALLEPGTLDIKELNEYIEIVSMSGLQTDVRNDYIGGEVRLAILYKDGKEYPITGFSISGSLKENLNLIRFTKEIVSSDRYEGPNFVMLKKINII